MPKWKNFDLLIKNFDFLIYERPGFAVEKFYGNKMTKIKAPLLDISSTQIREMIKNGNSIKFLVPDVVKEEIEKNHYYK